MRDQDIQIRHLLVGGKDTVGGELPPYSPDMVIGATARWDDQTAVTRTSEITWSFAPLA